MPSIAVKCLECNVILLYNEAEEQVLISCDCPNKLRLGVMTYGSGRSYITVETNDVAKMEINIVETKKYDPDYIPK